MLSVEHVCACSVAKLSLTLCDPMDGSPPGSPLCGVSQARKLDHWERP